MAFPNIIQKALEKYDQQKGFFRRLFGDHPAIAALRNLPIYDQDNLLKLYRQISKNPPEKSHASYQVYEAVLAEIINKKNNTNDDTRPINLNYSEIQECLSALNNNELLTATNFNALLANKDPGITQLLIKFHKAKLLTQNNFNILLENKHPDVTRLLIKLDEAKILTQNNFNNFFASDLEYGKNRASPLYPLITLHNNKLLTQQNFDTIVSMSSLSNRREVSSILDTLNDAKLLTQQNFDSIKNDTRETCNILRCLDRSGILTQSNFDHFISARRNVPVPYTIVLICQGNDILTQENYTKLLNHSFLLTTWAMQHIWSIIPLFQWTSDIFNHLVRLVQQPNPEENIQRYVNQLTRNEHIDNAPDRINNSQSTHTASVHQTTSESATRLFNRYGTQIEGEKLEQKIQEVQAFVNKLSNDSEKNKAAKTCLKRITADDYNFTDPTSQITTKQLVALTFIAICDRDNRKVSLEGAIPQFIEGLYEIQRDYNLSAQGIDQGGKDKPICSAGTFNKLIEKMQGIHPDCEIRFITHKTAAFKLPIVVREEALRYLSSLANPQTIQDLLSFTDLIDKIKKNGAEVIWDKIEEQISKRMFDEFGSLYHDRSDSKFTDFVKAGQDTELKDLDCFQKQISNSVGYQQYFSNTLRHSGGFFSSPKSTEFLSQHRHDNPEAQQEYDQKFGLVLK